MYITFVALHLGGTFFHIIVAVYCGRMIEVRQNYGLPSQNDFNRDRKLNLHAPSVSITTPRDKTMFSPRSRI